MDLPQIDGNAGWLAGLVFAASVLWKVWLRFKADKRDDRTADREYIAEGDVIEVLREEVKRLATSMRDVLKELDDERQARYRAERMVADLMVKVESLERRLRGYEQKP